MDDLGVIELEGPMDFDDLPNITKQKPVIFHNYFKLQGIASSQTMINHDLYVPQLGLSENTLHFMNCFFSVIILQFWAKPTRVHAIWVITDHAVCWGDGHRSRSIAFLAVPMVGGQNKDFNYPTEELMVMLAGNSLGSEISTNPDFTWG